MCIFLRVLFSNDALKQFLSWLFIVSFQNRNLFWWRCKLLIQLKLVCILIVHFWNVLTYFLISSYLALCEVSWIRPSVIWTIVRSERLPPLAAIPTDRILPTSVPKVRATGRRAVMCVRLCDHRLLRLILKRGLIAAAHHPCPNRVSLVLLLRMDRVCLFILLLDFVLKLEYSGELELLPGADIHFCKERIDLIN